MGLTKPSEDMAVCFGNQRFRRRYASRRKTVAITPLIDIMTILLIFILYHLSDKALIDISSEDLRLPASFTARTPDIGVDMVVISIGRDEVAVDNLPVISSQGLSEAEMGVVPEILGRLKDHRQREQALIEHGFQDILSSWVKVLGDEDLRFIDVLKVMRTCSKAGYEHVYLGALESP